MRQLSQEEMLKLHVPSCHIKRRGPEFVNSLTKLDKQSYMVLTQQMPGLGSRSFMLLLNAIASPKTPTSLQLNVSHLPSFFVDNYYKPATHRAPKVTVYT